MRRRLLLTFLAVMLWVGIAGPPALAQQDADLSREIVARLNAWRIGQGLWPLHPNPTLDALAAYQAEYLLSLPDLPDGVAIHAGRQGEGPRDRALWYPFTWPTYGLPERMALEEIACARHNASDPINFWQTSDIHARAALNDAYREIGVAVVEHRPGYYLFIVELAGRPGVLPVLIDPADRARLYLSNERYWGAGNGDWMQNAVRVRVLTGGGSVLLQWTPWQSVLALPQRMDAVFYVEYDDGTTVVRTAVNPAEDVALLPGYSPPTSVPAIPTPAAAPAPTVAVTVLPTVVLAPDLPTQAPAPAQADVLVIYDDHSLTLLNASPYPLNFSGLQLTGSGVVLDVQRWDTEYLSSSLDAFPPGHCLQTWAFGTGDFSRPPDCQARDAWITVQPGEQFWTRGDFTVQQVGQVIASCPAGAGRCAVDLP